MDATPDEFHAPPPLPASVSIGGMPPAAAGPGVWQALGLLLLYFVLQVVIGGIIGIFVGFVLGIAHGFEHRGSGQAFRAALARPDAVAIIVIVSLVAAAGVMFRMVHWRWPRLWSQPRMPGLGFTRPSHAGYYGLALATGLLMPFIGDLLTQWLARGHAVPQDIRQLGGNASLLLRVPLALLVVSVGPLVEELLFRGVLLSALMTPRPDYPNHVATTRGRLAVHGCRRIRQALAERLGRLLPIDNLRRGRTLAAVLLSALIFGLVHLPSLHYLWFAVPDLVLLGTALAWLRLRSQSIWPSVIAHGVNNLLAVVAWFVTAHPPG
jgi:membrane protease YdiL (CAAX protease family)